MVEKTENTSAHEEQKNSDGEDEIYKPRTQYSENVLRFTQKKVDLSKKLEVMTSSLIAINQKRGTFDNLKIVESISKTHSMSEIVTNAIKKTNTVGITGFKIKNANPLDLSRTFSLSEDKPLTKIEERTDQNSSSENDSSTSEDKEDDTSSSEDGVDQ